MVPLNDSLVDPSRSFPAPPEHLAFELWQKGKSGVASGATKTDMTG